MNLPNVIQPDQLTGFYVDKNVIGSYMLNIRGTTGHFPRQATAERLLSSAGLGSYGDVRNLITNDRPNGYTEYMRMINFFMVWCGLIADDPSRWAMVYINAKDGDFYSVLPMGLSFPRTAARPIYYSYALNFQVIDEQRPMVTAQSNSAIDTINQTMSQMNRWKSAINRAIVTTFHLAQHVINVPFAVANSESSRMASTLSAMADGLQGIAHTSNSVTSVGNRTRDTYADIKERVDRSLSGRAPSAGRVRPSHSTLASIVPPTRAAILALFSGTDTVIEEAANSLSRSTSSGTKNSINPNDPFIDAYGAALELLIDGAIAADLAPVPDYDPISSVANETRTVHRVARSGAVGMLAGREAELSSASYDAETRIVDGVRHPRGYSDEGTYSLSYLTALILRSWSNTNDGGISPALQSFRSAFLGMRDPSTLSALWKSVVIGRTDTIYTLAQRYLGSWQRWAEIAFINGLKYPYISPSGGLFCKVPGDEIYVPAKDAKISASLVESLLRTIKVHDKVTLPDVFLGFDIQVDSTGDAVYDKFDYAHTTGVDAFIQELAFVLEGSGGMTFDPDQGIGVKLGSKCSGVKDLTLWRGILNRWLVSDYRVESVDKLSLWYESQTLWFSVAVKFKDVGESLTISSAVRRN